MKKNFLLSLVTILVFFIIFFPFLNIVLGGVPLFNIFNLKIEDMVYVSKTQINTSTTNFDEEYFDSIDRCGKSENGNTNLIYRADRYGFRDINQNSNNYSDTDIIILGDSFGISSCVNFPNDLTSQLVKKTKNKKILNLSMGGTGPYVQSEMLKSLLKVTNTKFNTLIWIFYEGNDHEDINAIFDKPIYQGHNYKIGFNKFQELQPHILSFSKINKKILDEYQVDYKIDKNPYIIKLKLFLSFYFRGFGTLVKYTKKYQPLLDNEKYYESIIENFDEYLLERNVSDKIIYYLPRYTRLAYNKISHPQLNQLNNLKSIIKKVALKHDFKFIDGSDFFSEIKDPLSIFHYNLPTHFNEKGYDLLAEHLKMNIINR